jgi:predicted Zn-dependent protease
MTGGVCAPESSLSSPLICAWAVALKALVKSKKVIIILIMTRSLWTSFGIVGKALCAVFVLGLLASCSTNPATGEKQFAALMPPGQEASVGAQEHANVVKTYGNPLDGPAQAYVNRVGQRVAKDTERSDVTYKFYLLDSPEVNAFALPGGYVYVTRGLMAQANSEAELAGVLAHEIGHITARHSAERYSRGVLTTLGAAVIAAAADSPDAARVAGLGSDLYIKSYSRSQESQADELGIRYLHRAGYDVNAMASFLETMGAQSDLDARLTGREGGQAGFDYFATHPRTADRVTQARAIAAQYPKNEARTARGEYLQILDGMIYGDNTKQGFIRGRSFYHPDMDFTFTVPSGFTLVNQPAQVVATSPSGAVILFDAAANNGGVDPATYISSVWMKGNAPAGGIESISVNGHRAATASFKGSVNNKPMDIRIVAVEWPGNKFFRFQMAIPRGAGGGLVEDLKRTTYSLRPMTAQEKQDMRPYHIRIVTAKPGDTVQSLSSMMAQDDMREERFRVLNGLRSGNVTPGVSYKVIAAR